MGGLGKNNKDEIGIAFHFFLVIAQFKHDGVSRCEENVMVMRFAF